MDSRAVSGRKHDLNLGGITLGWGKSCFPSGAVVKHLTANVRDTRDVGSIPGSGRSPRLWQEIATQSSILAWKIPWTEEPSELQSMESQRVGHD